VVDATTNKRLAREFKLGAHPESFQMETSGPNSYVNVPDLKQIVVINRNTGNISHWPVAFDNNFPMALDEGGHRLFLATRAPARLAVFDTISGHMVTALPCVQNSDDLYFDAARKRIYVAGGEGYVNVFQQKDGELYNPAARGFLRRWTPARLGTSAREGRGSRSFSWPSLHAQMQERRSWSTPYRTSWLAQTVDQATSTRARSQ
jgi:hypothetical protein